MSKLAKLSTLTLDGQIPLYLPISPHPGSVVGGNARRQAIEKLLLALTTEPSSARLAASKPTVSSDNEPTMVLIGREQRADKRSSARRRR